MCECENEELKTAIAKSVERVTMAVGLNCCNFGEYKCQVPMPISGRRQDIDRCIADIVAALNAANITTVASCCGHKEVHGVVSLSDGRELSIILPK